MTQREIKISRRILDYLHELEGGQAHAFTIHGEIGGTGICSATEFDAVLAALDRKKFVMFIETQFKGRLWNITDAGEAARLQMAT